MKKILFLCVAVISLSIIAPITGAFAEEPAPTIVRVSILDDRDSIDLSLKGKYEIYAYKPERLLMDGPFLSAKVSGTKEGLLVGPREIKTAEINIRRCGTVIYM
ncbi:MAG: hypothetical protein PHI58_06520 [Candidatus Omnitrophica bacterium]|nr:hypothetical protein [Candidatus Omnitrophota bacterium]